MADGRFEDFRRALLGRGLFAHVAPLRLRPGVASIIWESLTSMRRCSREEFANNGSAQLLLYIYRYIYNTPTYGCTSMLTFILNVLGEVLGIGNLYCRPFYSAGSGPCARPRDFENRLLNDVLANFERFLPPLILEQTSTALLIDGQRHSFETAPNRSSTSPRAFFDNGRARLGGLHSAAWNT